jgi:maleylacetoacetate isomerase
MIRLYDYWRSSASYRVRIALNMTGEDWTSIPVNLVDGEQQSDAHLARNPQGLVPAIEMDGMLMTQSLSIIEYLDETRGLGLLPKSPHDRAKVRALSHAIAIDIHPICNLRVAKFAATQGGDITMESWMKAHIEPGLSAFEAMLEGGNFCFGDDVSLADLCLMPQVYNAERWGVDMSEMPKIQKVARNLSGIQAFADASPDAMKPAP